MDFASVKSTPAAASPVARLLLATAIALSLGLTVLHPSATRLVAWPWAAFATVAWLLPIAVVLRKLLRSEKFPRFGGTLDAGLALLAAAAVASALLSPQRPLALAAALPVLATCALPYALLPFFAAHRAQKTTATIGLLTLVFLGASALLWLQPWDWRGWPASRNDFPFGHANSVGSVGVLATSWLALCTVRHHGRARIFFAASTLFAAAVTLSSESRGAVLALGAAVLLAAAIFLLRRGRFLLFLLTAIAVLSVAIATNARLRGLVLRGEWTSAARESNDQRLAMLHGGLQLGLQRPFLGWGSGSVPHVFPRVRATLPGSADNIVQLHNSAAQTFATLGATGLLALLLIAAGLLRTVGGALRPDKRPTTQAPLDNTCLTCGLVAGGVVLLFDHPFAVPAFAVLAAAHLAAWRADDDNIPLSAAPRSRLVGFIALLALAPVLYFTARDLQARSAYAAALDAVTHDDCAAFIDALRRASAAMPADPFYRHQLAAHFATGHPFRSGSATTPNDPAAAIAELKVSLLANPNLEYAHYNLGWLLLDSAPAQAAQHFLSAGRLAPHRGAVYFGLGLAHLRLGARDAAVRAFATEFLNDPAFAWSPLWFDSPLTPLRPEILRLAASTPLPNTPAANALRLAWSSPPLSAPFPNGPAFRRVRTGYGVLMSHPDGSPPIDVNIQASPQLPPDLTAHLPNKGWLRGDFLLEFLASSPR
jgi:O-antigen ligase